MTAKQKILDILHDTDGIVSGETLSAALGVTRVSVWKHVKKMVQSGIPIVSMPKGYRLDGDPDHLFPWAFGSRKDRIHFFDETSSTMDEAMILARKGCPDFTVFITQRQTKGRGRMKRIWQSSDGGLYFTVVVRPSIPLIHVGLVNLAAAVDMAELLHSSYGIDAGVKWPNDILVGDRKICGVLSQMEAEGDQLIHVNVGIGLNVNNSPEIEEPAAASLKSLLGRSLPRRKILEAFLDAFERRITHFSPSDVIEKWRVMNVTLGQKVRIVTFNGRIEGIAVDVDEQGGLIVDATDGGRQTVTHGDCFHR